MRHSVKVSDAFSKVELLITVGIFGILICLIVINLRPAKGIRSSINCRNRIMQIGLAFRGFSEDHSGHFPMSISTNQGGTFEFAEMPDQTYRHFEVLSKQLGATYYLSCPQDVRRAATNWDTLANTNISYFVGLDTEPQLSTSIVAGDRNITVLSDVIFRPSHSTSPSWVASVGLHGNRGHLAFADGHVEEVNSLGLSNAIQRTGIMTNRFAVP